MKKFYSMLSIIALMLFAFSVNASALDNLGKDNTVSIPALSVKAGAEFELSVVLKNETAVTAFQMDVMLPEGFTVLSDADGYYVDLASERKTRSHIIGGNYQEDGTFRVLAYSSSNADFKGNDGAIFTLTLKAADGIPAGDYPVSLRNVIITEYDWEGTTEIGHNLEDFSGAITVETASSISNLNCGGDTTISVSNLSGQQVFKGRASEMPTLPKGVYIMKQGGRTVKVSH